MDMAHRWLIRALAVPLGVAVLLGAGLTGCSSGSGSSTNCVDRLQHDATKGYKLISTTECQDRSPGAAYYYRSHVKNGWVTGGTFTKPRSSYGSTSKHRSGTSGGSGSRKRRR